MSMVKGSPSKNEKSQLKYCSNCERLSKSLWQSKISEAKLKAELEKAKFSIKKLQEEVKDFGSYESRLESSIKCLVPLIPDIDEKKDDFERKDFIERQGPITNKAIVKNEEVSMPNHKCVTMGLIGDRLVCNYSDNQTA